MWEAWSSDVNSEPVPCIWCLSLRYEASDEHVLPEALGCPPHLVLKRGVCRPCNTRLGHVDQALLRQFELPSYMLAIPRKGGRRPTVDTWASLLGRWSPAGPELHVNAGPGDLMVSGRRILSASHRTGLLDPKLEIDGAVATASFGLPFGQDPKFARAVYKVALGVLALERGPTVAAHPMFDAVRAFVLQGEGAFGLLMPGEVEPFATVFRASIWEGAASHPIIALTFFGVPLLADLDPEQGGVRALREGLEAEVPAGEWFWLPPLPPKRTSGRKRTGGR